MSDRELIEALYQRIEAGAIRLDLLSQGAGYARVGVLATDWGVRYGFEAMAYAQPVEAQ